MDAIQTDYSAIALVIDRSGSMMSIAEDTKGGIKQFIQAQKQKEGKATLTLAQFDHEYQVLNHFSELNTVDEDAFVKQYEPRGTTALLDAIGRTVIEMGQKIEKMEPAEKPAHVIVAIVTDGQENASRDFTVEKIKSLIAEKKALGWNFIFLGADLDVMTVGQRYGFEPKEVAYFQSSNVNAAMQSIEKQVSDARTGKAIFFSPEEREELAISKITKKIGCF